MVDQVGCWGVSSCVGVGVGAVWGVDWCVWEVVLGVVVGVELVWGVMSEGLL